VSVAVISVVRSRYILALFRSLRTLDCLLISLWVTAVICVGLALLLYIREGRVHLYRVAGESFI